MSFLWTIYGDELIKERKNKLLQFIFGSVKIDRKEVWMKEMESFFGEYKLRVVNIGRYTEHTVFLDDCPSVAFINLRERMVEICFHEDFLPKFNAFVEKMFPEESVGITLRDCEVTKKGREIISIKKEGKEIYINGLDQLKNELIVI
ncbi:hypothetical protein [Metabacillus fastidiosus]|uniref:hypothetical protein n=1 Tax=Metabacillus fastidiosus TaxID=1458 RepID=UPI003D292093